MINENAITLVMWKEYGKGKEFGGQRFLKEEEGETIWKWHCRQGRNVSPHCHDLMTDGAIEKAHWKGLQGHRGGPENWV